MIASAGKFGPIVLVLWLLCLRVFSVAGVPGEICGMLESERCNVKACSWGSGRSCKAQVWDCGEGACAVRLVAAVVRGALPDT